MTEAPPAPNMAWVRGATFRMGSDDHYCEEAPAHAVAVEGFWIDAIPVTAGRYTEFVMDSGYVTVAERPLDPAEFPAHRRRTWSPARWCSPEHRGRSISDT